VIQVLPEMAAAKEPPEAERILKNKGSNNEYVG
jgi:hypothetical protein